MSYRKTFCYVAYLDLLGFSGLVCSNPELAFEHLNKLRNTIDSRDKDFVKTIVTGESIYVGKYLKYFSFSDSVIYYTAGDSPEELLSIVFGAGGLVAKSINANLPIRGGISYGEIYIDEDRNLFCGLPFVKAHYLSENAQWFGLVIDDTVADRYINNPLLDKNIVGLDTILQWNVPIRNGFFKNMWCFNWVSPLSPKFIKPIDGRLMEGEHIFNRYKDIFQQNFTDLRQDIRDKYINTARFVNYIFRTYH